MPAPTPAPSDLRSLDRDVARAWAAWGAWITKVARAPEEHADEEPLERWRHVTGQSTYDALGALTPSVLDVPLRDALRRWVHALLQARLARPQVAEIARVRAEASARITVPEARLVAWDEAWRGVLASPTSVERDAWIDAAAQRGPAIAAIVRSQAERRTEVARRKGLEHEDPLVPFPAAALVAAAEAVLARTQDLASALLREARTRGELADDPPLAGDAIAIAVARDAPEGWPARLAPRWLESTFGELSRGLRLQLAPLPAPVGASSFARACASFGAALRVAGASPSLPFALARDPQFVAKHRFACVFGALPASPAFQRRILGHGARIAANQARVLGRTALFAARWEAARYLLSPHGTLPARDRFEDVTTRLLGAPLPAALTGAFPARYDDGAARLAGLLTAPELAAQLVDRFDVDWFANPRAVPALRGIASGPAAEAPPSDDAATRIPDLAGALARAFEEALG
jgi:hypothetical protein